MITDVLNSEGTDLTEIESALESIINKSENTNGEPIKCEVPASNTLKIESNFDLSGANGILIQDGLKFGHHIFEIKFKLNNDLLDYNEGPIKFFYTIQSVGMLVDMQTDHSSINSLEDVLKAMDDKATDVYMEILVTTILEKQLFANVLSISEDRITEIYVKKDDSVESENIVDVSVKEENKIEEEIKSDIAVVEKKQKDFTEKEKSIVADESIRVHVSVLNDLLNMASEMVLGRNQLLRTLENYKKNIPGLSPILQNVDFLTSSMQEKIMQTRMQPVGNIFNKFPRLIRDLSKNLSKEMELVIEGADVELDKSIVEGLGDPLTHLIRNSADHGIEMPDMREKQGKSRKATIKLKAYHECGAVNIDVSDDGRGMDVEKIKKSALEKGLFTKTELDMMNEQEILKIIFRPGFSTAAKVSDVSGRGVGMDVVKTNIEKLGGTVEIITNIGTGTTIRLELPLTLAIVQSLVVSSNSQRFIIPQVDVQEIVKIKKGSNDRYIEFVQDSEVLRLRGKLIPIVHLAEVLKIENDLEESKDVSVLIIRRGKRRYGLVVDVVLGSEETLVKSVPYQLRNSTAYSGVTIMGDGKIAMILDSEGIIKLADLKFIEENTAVAEGEVEKKINEEIQNLLLFKCSGEELFAINIALVARLEKIKYEEVKYIGNEKYIVHRNKSLRVVRPENYLKVGKKENNPKYVYVIIPKLVSHPIGILVESIVDSIDIKLEIATDEIGMKGLVGTSIYKEQVMLILNIYDLFELVNPEHYIPKNVKTHEGKKILYVEDTPFFQRMGMRYLEAGGYKVYLAENGREALSILGTQKIDVVVSDIQMPVMDGYELVMRMKESSIYNQIPVIAVTALTGDFNRNIGLEKGFDYYEYKLDKERLLNTIDIALTNSARR